ncbi:MAG TPA: CHC2 zinc finger domain-containing protein [Bradyrhizobium sp.]|nr:CHC2 zinc finger domain-containing protein [Bradyrhizobium sp.]
MSADVAALFERAREADIKAVAGVKLYRSGRRMRGPCPLCGASEKKRADGAFSVDPHARLFKCFACLKGGDVIDLEQLLNGGTAREAAERLVGAAPAAVARSLPARSAPETVAPTAPNAEAAARTWRQSQPARGTLVANYLASRGIVGAVAAAALQRLRFHPNAYWGEDERGQRIWLPAMVAMVRAPEGPTGGVHLTYLAPGGAGKTTRSPAKRMLGAQRRDGCAGGVWLSDPTSKRPLLVGEGIESTLSAAQLMGQPFRMLATLSLGALQGVWLPDKWGRIDPDCVALDDARPPLTWPEPSDAPWGEVLIAVDRDMKPIKVKCRRAGGGSYDRWLSAEERARICAGLAEQAWRKAGANAVRSIAPGPGRDFNDELRARTVGGAA